MWKEIWEGSSNVKPISPISSTGSMIIRAKQLLKKIFRKVKQEEYRLEDDEINKRLCIEDSSIVDEIHKTCIDMLQEENRRTEHIDSKSTSFAGIIGLSSGLVFSLGGILIEKITNTEIPFFGCPIPWLVSFYLSSFLTLLVALCFCVRAFLVRTDFRGLNDVDIFHEEMLGDEDTTQYKRYMTTHIWKVFRTNFKINNTKAKNLKISQITFTIGLMQLVLIMAIIGLYSLKKGGFF